MLLMPGLSFIRHTVGRWETVHSARPGSKQRATSQRQHVLAFTCDELDIDFFAPVGKVNDDSFLGAGPGRVMCGNVSVTRSALPVNGRPHPTLADVEQESGQVEPLWLLEYHLVETSTRAWDDIPSFAMTPFFGTLS